MALKDFLKATLEIDTDDIFHVDVMESFSFFNTPNSLQEKVIEKFTDFKIDGRFINVEISEKGPKGRSGGGKRRSYNKNDSSGGGGYKKKFNSGGSGGGGYDRGKRRSFDNNPDKRGGDSGGSPRRSNSGSKPTYGSKGNKPGGFGRRSRS